MLERTKHHSRSDYQCVMCDERRTSKQKHSRSDWTKIELAGSCYRDVSRKVLQLETPSPQISSRDMEMQPQYCQKLRVRSQYGCRSTGIKFLFCDRKNNRRQRFEKEKRRETSQFKLLPTQ